MAISVVEDMGFCSGEDYLESDIHSPTDTSEDSLEVKISPIQSMKAKRKNQDTFSGPLKKRMCLKVKAEESHPFRPWSPQNKLQTGNTKVIKSDYNSVNTLVPSAPSFLYNKNDGYFRPPSPIRDEPVSLVKNRENVVVSDKIECDIKTEVPRVPVHPTNLTPQETEEAIQTATESFPALQQNSKKTESSRREQRNYKNMTRERRIEANARERTRVHTISAAFDTLRKAIPSYSHNQKLSKLSVLRIACSYIMTLSSMVSEESTEDTAECVDLVTKTIQKEGKLRKKKDDND